MALDFHTNLTANMVDNATVIDGYRTYPHIDMYATGKRAAETLFQIIDQKLKTKMCWRSLPTRADVFWSTLLWRQVPISIRLIFCTQTLGERARSTQILLYEHDDNREVSI